MLLWGVGFGVGGLGLKDFKGFRRKQIPEANSAQIRHPEQILALA